MGYSPNFKAWQVLRVRIILEQGFQHGTERFAWIPTLGKMESDGKHSQNLKIINQATV